MAGASIVAAGWAYSYPGSAEHVLADVSLCIEPGELVVLMGASGAGKSTVLLALAGTLPEGGATGRLDVAGGVGACGVGGGGGGGPDGVGRVGGSGGAAESRGVGGAGGGSGESGVGGGVVESLGLGGGGSAEGGGGEGGACVRVGLVQQQPEANIVMQRVGDDVAFPLENAAVPTDEIWPRVGAMLGLVGLDVEWDRSTGQLSGGQQQLLGVAGAGVADPALLLLDEPTANLDPTAAAAVLAAVAAARAATGVTVLVVEHRVEPWLAAADRVLLVEDRAVLDLTPDELRAHLAGRPESAARIWLDHDQRRGRPPLRAPGREVLVATEVVVEGRLAATGLVARAGEVVALTGAPGSGKSTLLAVLAGLLKPSTGSVCLPGDSRPTRCDPWRWQSAEVAATFGVVFQNPEHQFVTGRVLDEVHHGLVGAGVAEPDATWRAMDMLARLDLTGLADRNPFTLSGGEQRRLSVGTALALDPGILVLDEPTFGQDPTTWGQMIGIIADHRDAGGAVVLATHDPALVRALGAREVRLHCARQGEASPPVPGSIPSPQLDPATAPVPPVSTAEPTPAFSTAEPTPAFSSAEPAPAAAPTPAPAPASAPPAAPTTPAPPSAPTRTPTPTLSTAVAPKAARAVAPPAVAPRATTPAPPAAPTRTPTPTPPTAVAPKAARAAAPPAVATRATTPAPTAEAVPIPAPAPPAGAAGVAGQPPTTRDVWSGQHATSSAALSPPKRLRRLDPLALVGGAMLLSVAGLVSGSVALNLALAALSVLAALVGGLPARRVALLASPALLATASVALSNALLSQAGITSAAAWSAAALPASRVLAVALPGLVAAVAVDPTCLADALVVRLRVPARAAYAVLAGLRLLPLLADEWTVLGRASRARGLAGRGLRDRARQFASMGFRLLVAALRRGGRLAVALDARGLAAGRRTVARPVHWRWPDTVAIVVTAGLLVVAILASAAGIIGG